MANDKNLKPFQKGDPRINRKGRPKSFDALRALALQLSHEQVDTPQGKMTAVEVILRQMAKDPKQRQLFLEYAYGKVPQAVDVNTDGKITLSVVYQEKTRPDESND